MSHPKFTTALGDRLKKDMFFGTSADFPQIVELKLAQIVPNPDQPRKTFDAEALAELARSIEKHGLIQPITVKRYDGDDDRYLLVAGERRFRAFEQLGRPTIPAIITTGDAEEIALIENIQREDLNPLEEAEALERMMDRYHYTQEELGKVIGKAQNTVSEVLQLNTLPPSIKDEYRTSDTRTMSKSALVELTRIKDAKHQKAVWEAMKAGRWTVRDARTAKRRTLPPKPVQDRAIEVGRAFLSRIEAIEVIDAAHYHDLLVLLETFRDQLDRLRPPQDESKIR